MLEKYTGGSIALSNRPLFFMDAPYCDIRIVHKNPSPQTSDIKLHNRSAPPSLALKAERDRKLQGDRL